MPDRDQDVSLFKHLAGGAGIGGTLGGLATAVGTGIMNYGPRKAVGHSLGLEDFSFRQFLDRINPKDSAHSLRNVVSGIGIGAALGAGGGGLAYFIEKRKREREEAEAMNRRLLEHLAVQVAEKTAGEEKPSLARNLAVGGGTGALAGGLGGGLAGSILPYVAIMRLFGQKPTAKEYLSNLREVVGNNYVGYSTLAGAGLGSAIGAGIGALKYRSAKKKWDEENPDMNKKASFQAFLKKVAGEEDPYADVANWAESNPEGGYVEFAPGQAEQFYAAHPNLRGRGQIDPESEEAKNYWKMRAAQMEEQFPDQGQPIEEDIYDPEKMGSYDPVRLQRIGNEKSKMPRTTSALKKQAPLPKKTSNNDCGC